MNYEPAKYVERKPTSTCLMQTKPDGHQEEPAYMHRQVGKEGEFAGDFSIRRRFESHPQRAQRVP